jgi:hypothetical protein
MLAKSVANRSSLTSRFLIFVTSVIWGENELLQPTAKIIYGFAMFQYTPAPPEVRVIPCNFNIRL